MFIHLLKKESENLHFKRFANVENLEFWCNDLHDTQKNMKVQILDWHPLSNGEVDIAYIKHKKVDSLHNKYRIVY